MSEGERGLKKQRESKRSGASEEGGQWVLGLPRGTAGTGGAAEVAEAVVHWYVHCAQ